MKGHKFSIEHRARISAALIGRKNSFEHCSNISAAMMGHVVNAKTRVKISAALTGRKLSDERRAKLVKASITHGLSYTSEYHRAREHARRAHKLHNGGVVTATELLTLPKFCTYCFNEDSLTFDHIVPLSRGGRNDIENITTACQSCNFSKHNRMLDEWFGTT